MNFFVRVTCMTYNQSTYITDAMNGFCMQQTNFPFVCTIMDDASTDGEQNVIKQYFRENFDVQNASVAYEKDTAYGHISYAQHKTNRNCFFAIIYLNENHYSKKKPKRLYLSEWLDTKYVALCEGDDYWTDPLKLQKQVDFMEMNADFSLCCHRYKIYYQNSDTWETDYVDYLFQEEPDGFVFGNWDNLRRAWITKTMTLVYRNSCYDYNELKKYSLSCDVHMNYHLLLKGKGYCFPFVGAVYRICDTGVCSALSEEMRTKRWFRLRCELLEYNIYDKDVRDSVYYGLREHMIEGDTFGEMWKYIRLCYKSYFKTENVVTIVSSARKMFGSYLKGLKKKTI